MSTIFINNATDGPRDLYQLRGGSDEHPEA
jgi:hypothetical protein